MNTAISQLQELAETTGDCATQAETAAAAQLELVRRTKDAKAFETSRDAAEAALAQRQELRTQYLGGAKVSPPYGGVGRMVVRAKAEAKPRLAALIDAWPRISSRGSLVRP